MKDKYNDYQGEVFNFFYPITWVKRNKDYLKKRYDRRKQQDYITPPQTKNKNEM